MTRWAITLLILGVGSFILPMFGLQFRILSIFGPAQQVVGAILAVAGFLMLLSGFLNREGIYTASEYRPLYEYIPPPNQPPANPTQQPAALPQNASYNVPSQGYSQSAPGAAPLYFQAPLPPPPPTINQAPIAPILQTPRLTPIGQANLPAFNQAVAQAQAENTAEAYAHFKTIEKVYPYDVNLLLWVAFTSPQLEEARKSVALARSLEPQNPSIAQAEQWLTRKTANRV